MKLARREIIVVGAGAAILVAALGHRAWTARAAAGVASKDTIAGAIDRIRLTDGLRKSVAESASELGVNIPDAAPGEQETRIREDLGRLAQESGLQFRSIRRATESSRSQAGAAKPIEFRLDLGGPFESVMKYIHTLERSPTPFVVAEVSIESTSRRGRSQQQQGIPTPPPSPPLPGTTPPEGELPPEPPPPQGPGMVRATMKVKSYLFPEVVLAERTPAPSPTPEPSPSGTAGPGGGGAKGTSASAKGSPAPGGSPGASPTPK